MTVSGIRDNDGQEEGKGVHAVPCHQGDPAHLALRRCQSDPVNKTTDEVRSCCTWRHACHSLLCFSHGLAKLRAKSFHHGKLAI